MVKNAPNVPEITHTSRLIVTHVLLVKAIKFTIKIVLIVLALRISLTGITGHAFLAPYLNTSMPTL